MEIEIRKAERSDAALVSAIAIETYVAAFADSMAPSDLRAHVDRKLLPAAFENALGADVILLAETSERLVGYAQFGRAQSLRAFGADNELRRLYVHESCQSQGIGSRLMQQALEHPALADAHALGLDVWVENTRAQHFYRRHGFEPVAERKFEVASGADTTPDIIMIRRAALGAEDASSR